MKISNIYQTIWALQKLSQLALLKESGNKLQQIETFKYSEVVLITSNEKEK